MREFLKKPYLYAGSLVATVVVWAFATAGDAIQHGHPSYWVAYGLAAGVAAGAIVAAVVWASRPTRIVLSTAATLLLAVAGGLAWWLTPFPADAVAIDAMASDDHVVVESTASRITMEPVDGRSGIGIVFLPGAKVDARAYARMLRPLADAGHSVMIVKEPLGIAFFSLNAAPRWAAQHPEARWVVGGHSLGGVVAAQNAAAANSLDGLVLWASYPANDVSDRAFEAVSIFGTNDGLTTPEQIEASRADLPADTTYVPIEGGVHSHFGDYGTQPGDGEPSTPRVTAQARIVAATLDFLSPRPGSAVP